MIVSFFIPGKIEPKGRARSSIAKGKQGLFVRHHTPAATRNFEALVRHECEQAMRGRQFAGPVKATMLFSMPRPKDKTREYFCTVKPDADNLAKSILDACNLIAWRDDCIVAQLEVTKALETEVNPAGVYVWLEDAEVPEGWALELEERDAAKQRAKDEEKAARQAIRDAVKAEKKRLAAEAREAKKRRAVA